MSEAPRWALGAQLLVATRNRGKLRELRALFDGFGVEIVDLDAAGIAEAASEEGALEAFETFEENALAKARHFHARSGLPTIADDSGLVVDALGGAPGVRSKRFAGATGASGLVDRANNEKLQRELGSQADRRGRFVCAAAFVDGERELVTRGEAAGQITTAPRGGDGFGYDPYFLSDDLGVTFGEASVVEKERVSHRGRAFRALVAAMVVSADVPSDAVDGPGRPG